MKIAFVTFEYEGITKNGGIGTAYRRLSDLLIDAGHKVTIVFMPFPPSSTRIFNKDKEIIAELQRFKKKNLKIVMPAIDQKHSDLNKMDYNLRRSMIVYRYLSSRSFDVVHAADNCGLAFFALQAKKLGVAFSKTKFIIGTHGSPLWTQEANRNYSTSALCLSELDRLSTGNADILVSPSEYMLGYLKKKKWALPKTTLAIPNINSLSGYDLKKHGSFKHASNVGKKKTLVFFGRMERRKGVFLFVDALQQLMESKTKVSELEPLEVIFLGRDERPIPGMSTREWIQNRLGGFGNRLILRYMPDCSSEESLNFLAKKENALVCMPSLIDNSPYVVLEAIERGLDFISSSSGGQAELIHPEDRAEVLFQPTKFILAKMLEKRLLGPRVQVRPSREVTGANVSWLKVHASIQSDLKKSKAAQKKFVHHPQISIVLGSIHAFTALPSIFDQDYPNIQVCLPRGLSFPYRIHRKGLTLTTFEYDPQTHDFSHALRVVSGKYVLFLEHESALYDRKTLSRWIRAAENIDDRREWAALVGFDVRPKSFPRDDHKLGASKITARSLASNAKVIWHIPNVSFGYVGALLRGVPLRFALWRAEDWAKSMKGTRANLGDPLRLDLYSQLMVSGRTVEVYPEPVIRSIPLIDPILHVSCDPLSSVEPLLKRKGSLDDWRNMVMASVASYTELNSMGLDYWKQKETIDHLKRLISMPHAKGKDLRDQINER